MHLSCDVSNTDPLFCALQVQHHAKPLTPFKSSSAYCTPFIFSHPFPHTNSNAHVTAAQVCEIIDVYMNQVPDLRPSDVAILCTRSNSNQVFFQLEKMLKEYYQARFKSEHAVTHFVTRDEVSAIHEFNHQHLLHMLEI